MTGVLFFSVLMIIAGSFAVRDELLVDAGKDDTAVVESMVREVRQAVPTNLKDLLEAGAKLAYIHTYNDGGKDGNEKGYYKKADDKGNDGYKHFDSYHKKNSDKYGYETQSAYGKYAKDENEAGAKRAKYGNEGDDKAAYRDGQQGSEGDDGEETKTTYHVVESVDEDEGDSNQYAAGDDGGYSEQYTEGGDSGSYDDSESYAEGNPEHYGDGGDGGDYKLGYDGGNYGSEGSLGHEGGSSAYSYDGGETDGELEHYTAEDEDDY